MGNSYEPGIAPNTRCPQQGQGQESLTCAVSSQAPPACHGFRRLGAPDQSAFSPRIFRFNV